MNKELIALLEDLDSTYAWLSQTPAFISNSNFYNQLDSQVQDQVMAVIEELSKVGYEPAVKWLKDLDTAEEDSDFLTESESIQTAIEWLKNK